MEIRELFLKENIHPPARFESEPTSTFAGETAVRSDVRLTDSDMKSNIFFSLENERIYQQKSCDKNNKNEDAESE